MVVCDFNFVSKTSLPPKADSELIVDTETVHTCPVTSETLQSIAWWYRQIPQAANTIDLVQLPPRDPPQIPWTRFSSGPCVTAVKDIFRSAIAKRTDHAFHYNA